MNHMENSITSDLTPDVAALVHLAKQALISGTIREDHLLACLRRLKASPEDIEKFCAKLRDAQVQIVRPEEDPQHTPNLFQKLIGLLEQEEDLLSERETLVLTMRLKENKSVEEVAALMGVTCTRILQLERKAIDILYRRLRASRNRKIRDFYE